MSSIPASLRGAVVLAAELAALACFPLGYAWEGSLVDFTVHENIVNERLTPALCRDPYRFVACLDVWSP